MVRLQYAVIPGIPRVGLCFETECVNYVKCYREPHDTLKDTYDVLLRFTDAVALQFLSVMKPHGL